MILAHECAYLIRVYKDQRKGLGSEEVMMVSISKVVKTSLGRKQSNKTPAEVKEQGLAFLGATTSSGIKGLKIGH